MKIRDASRAAFMRPTRWAESSGALVVSLVLIPWIGSQQTQRVLLIASAAERADRAGSVCCVVASEASGP